MKVKRLLKEFGFVIFSNFLTLAVSTVVILVVPKMIGVKEYGYWQLFMFYSGYLGLLPLGWLDGIYLRYGGNKYNQLDKKIFKSQFLLLMILQLVFASILVILALLMQQREYSFILYSLALYLLIYIAQSFCKFILQITNRIQEYSQITILSNGVYLVTVVILICFNIQDFQQLILAFIFGNFVALLYGMYALKDLFLEEFDKKYLLSWREARLNIGVGIQLLVANAAAMLILGVVRVGIQRGWGVTVFGKVSLILSISNLLMIFINAISLVLFPKLKRVTHDKINRLYPAMRDLLMPTVFTGILIYFPLQYLIPYWLPNYSSVLAYMSVLFPMVVYQSKFEILSNTFMKVLRMERNLLVVNIFTLILSIVLTGISVFLLHNLTMTVLVIIVVMAFRSTLSELYIKTKLDVKFSFEIILEFIMVVAFILMSWYLSELLSMIGYISLLIIYFFIKRKNIHDAILMLKEL